MKKAAIRHDKYFLRELHQEIDYYDRKLAYLNEHMVFVNVEQREEAEKKLHAKRSPLERTAKDLAASGVEYDLTELPRSFRAEAPIPAAVRKPIMLVPRA